MFLNKRLAGGFAVERVTRRAHRLSLRGCSCCMRESVKQGIRESSAAAGAASWLDEGRRGAEAQSSEHRGIQSPGLRLRRPDSLSRAAVVAGGAMGSHGEPPNAPWPSRCSQTACRALPPLHRRAVCRLPESRRTLLATQRAGGPVGGGHACVWGRLGRLLSRYRLTLINLDTKDALSARRLGIFREARREQAVRPVCCHCAGPAGGCGDAEVQQMPWCRLETVVLALWFGNLAVSCSHDSSSPQLWLTAAWIGGPRGSMAGIEARRAGSCWVLLGLGAAAAATTKRELGCSLISAAAAR